MNTARSHMAHPRFCPARWPEPLTASGAAQACPTCLPSPANQLTFQANPCLGRPLKKGNRFAPCHSSNGGWTSFDLSSGAPGNEFRVSLNHPARPFGFPTFAAILLRQMTVRIALFLRKSAERKKHCFSAALRVSGTLREGHRRQLISETSSELFNPIK